MNRLFVHIVTVLAGLLLAVPALRAQIYYSCDFENAQQRQSWTLSPAGEDPCENTWLIGQPGNFSQSGAHGLYISNNGVDATYGSTQASYTIAYDALTLQAGSYVIDFDWRLAGNGQSATLYVLWVPDSDTDAEMESYVGFARAPWFGMYTLGNVSLHGKRVWTPQRINFTISAADAGSGKLCFAFSSARDNSTPTPPSACVDNIVVHAAGSCAKPTGFKYDESNGTLSWNSTATEWQVRDYCSYEGNVKEYDQVTTKSLDVQMEGEGTHVFYVRSVCGDGVYSEWVSIQEFVWIPGARCLDYMDLSNPLVATCYTGTANATGGAYGSQGGYNAFATAGVVSGTAGDWSRGSHTLHTNPDEFDPNTENMLPTVPEGELLSIRLGNSSSGSGAEGIVYSMTIPKGESRILKLKYALVLQNGGHDNGGPEAGPHGSNEQSHFYVEVRDQYGKPQGKGCSTFDFSCDPGLVGVDPTWHEVSTGSSSSVVWKEWTEVYISLVEFAGQTIQIRLSNYDCTAGGHYGYAYFAMGCIDGGLQGVACGDFETDHFEAPHGFDYRWYSANDPTKSVLCTDQVFNIDKTTDEIYLVDVINKVNDCYYVLTANPNPRFPLAQGDTAISHTGCKNLVTFSNSSVVRVVNRRDGSTMSVDEPIYDCWMVYGDGDSAMVHGTSFSHEYPVTGGHFVAKMCASMSNGMCQDTLVYEFDLPDILHTGSTDTIHQCRADGPVRLPNGEEVTKDTVYTSFTPNKYGCDAPNDLHVFFHDAVASETHENLCEGGYFPFEGVNYDKSGVYPVTLQTRWGCDSTLTLHLNVIPRLEVETPDTIHVCGDMGGQLYIPLTTLKGQYYGTTVHVDGDTVQFAKGYEFGANEEVIITLPDSVRPDYYHLTMDMSTPECPADSKHLVVVIHYASVVLDQKNGFVALLNERHNYGQFDYLTYQWYRNGEKMEGENESYIHVDDSDLNADFTVEVTRKSDGVVLTTCPITYTGGAMGYDDVMMHGSVAPTLLERGQRIRVDGVGQVSLCDIVGRSYETTTINGVGELHAPMQSGIYFVTFNHHDAVKIIVR